MIKVQHDDFDAGNEIAELRGSGVQVGAIVSFVGTVREFSGNDKLVSMTLEHYPIMTQKSLEKIVKQAKSRWDVHEVRLIHRVGCLFPADQIVFVGVSSMHRGQAFMACEFVMDFLKTSAPLWKKECLESGSKWVDEREGDIAALSRWEQV